MSTLRSPRLIEDSIRMTVVEYGTDGIITDPFLNFEVGVTNRIRTYYASIALRFARAGDEWDPFGTPIFLILPGRVSCPLCGFILMARDAWETAEMPNSRHCIKCYSMWRPQMEDTETTMKIASRHPTLGKDILRESSSFYHANLQSYTFIRC